MRRAEARRRPVPAMTLACRFPTALGECRVSWNGHGVVGFALPPAPGPGGAPPPPLIAAVIARCQRQLAGDPQDFSDVPIDGTRLAAFARGVYEETRRIPAGRTATYGDLARRLGFPPGASRAVGAALGANPIPLLIPCHRVVAANGKMTGFSAPGGVALKVRLLALERAELALH